MKTKKIIPDPEKKLAVIRRYLHILALLQNNKDKMDWNGTSLSKILMEEEYKKFSQNKDIEISDKSIRDYINKNLKEELGIDIGVEKGGRRIELKSLPDDMLEQIVNVYSSFVVTDSSKNLILKNFIKRHRYDCLWILGRLYFASLSKNSVQFDYINNAGGKLNKCVLNPYYLFFRNNNLYLYGRLDAQKTPWLFILNRVTNIKVLDKKFEDEIPSVEEIFQDTLGSFIGKKYNVAIEFTKDVQNPIEQFLSIVEPIIEPFDGGKRFSAEFKISDPAYLCKQLFLYGKNVRIIKPKEVKDMMIKMLKESLRVYDE